jgi:type VI secretion system protein ImpJ
MSWDSKVLWSEGLFLQPQHFQQADRYTEALVSGLARRVSPYAWGLSEIEIDEELLKTGRFALHSCSGLTPDGAVFRVPQVEQHPPPLEVPETIKECVVCLTVPQRRQGGSDVEPERIGHDRPPMVTPLLRRRSHDLTRRLDLAAFAPGAAGAQTRS